MAGCLREVHYLNLNDQQPIIIEASAWMLPIIRSPWEVGIFICKVASDQCETMQSGVDDSLAEQFA